MPAPYIVVGLTGGLKEFKQAIANPELPCVDLDAVLEYVVDAISHRTESEQELHYLKHELLCSEVLCSRGAYSANRNSHDSFYEDMSESVFGLEYVAGLAQKLGRELKQQFKNELLFNGEELPYEYHGIIDEATIILRPRR